MKMKKSKLVRDKIPEIIEGEGRAPMVHTADDAEYWQKLKEKLLEEVEEFKKDENREELADILEVLEAIVEYKGFSGTEIEKIKEKKVEERGAFKKRIILEV